MIAGGVLILVMLPALISALVMRGGLVLHGLGIAVVRADGREISRFRSFARAIIAWSPILLLLGVEVMFFATLGRVSEQGFDRANRSTAVAFWLLTHLSIERASLLAVSLMAVGGLIATAFPERGLQDRIARTWLVPR
jgi:cytochrome bd-type quinol oxidase subunit 2